MLKQSFLYLLFQSRPVISLTETLISVVITAYNRREFLPFAIRSVLEQDAPLELFELILVTNMKEKFIPADTKVKSKEIFDESINMGGMLKRGIIESTGEYIVFLDDDDIFTKDKISKILNVLKTSKFDYYHNGTDFIDSHGNKAAYKWRVTKISKEIRKSWKKKNIRTFLQNGLDFNMSSTAIRKKTIEKYLTFLDQLSANPDRFFLYMVLEEGGIVYMEKNPLTHYRLHRSTSRPADAGQNFVKYYNTLFTKSLVSMKLIETILKRKQLILLANLQTANLVVRMNILNKTSKTKMVIPTLRSIYLLSYDFYRYNILVSLSGILYLIAPRMSYNLFVRFNS